MKNLARIGLSLLIAVCLLNIAGCKKKEEPVKPPAQPSADVRAEAAKAVPEQPKAAATATEVKTETVAANAEQIKTAVSESTPLADVKAEAGKMNLEQLKAKAMEYKDLIVAKKATLAPLTEKLKAIPLTDQMGTEAKGLQTEISTMSKSVSALTDRFQVYYNKIKEMGGDVSGLGI
jgi:hypothetical protein